MLMHPAPQAFAAHTESMGRDELIVRLNEALEGKAKAEARLEESRRMALSIRCDLNEALAMSEAARRKLEVQLETLGQGKEDVTSLETQLKNSNAWIDIWRNAFEESEARRTLVENREAAAVASLAALRAELDGARSRAGGSVGLAPKPRISPSSLVGPNAVIAPFVAL